MTADSIDQIRNGMANQHGAESDVSTSKCPRCGATYNVSLACLTDDYDAAGSRCSTCALREKATGAR